MFSFACKVGGNEVIFNVTKKELTTWIGEQIKYSAPIILYSHKGMCNSVLFWYMEFSVMEQFYVYAHRAGASSVNAQR